MATAKRTIRIKRIYEKPDKDDGFRVLVDRLWPRGISKDKAQIDLWHREIAPSTELRKQYHPNPDKWPEFRKAYFKELRGKEDQINELFEKAGTKLITLLYAARDEKQNNAVALMEYLKTLP